tara:strand:+ start:432 stop:704 length:273 start_codon:yes stop_codon:yes gene_type:complete
MSFDQDNNNNLSPNENRIEHPSETSYPSNIPQNEFLKFAKQVGAELLFQSITVEAEQTLHAVHVVVSSIFLSKGFELFVHARVEVITQKV